MGEHCTGTQLEGYRERTLAPAELIAVDDHLHACAECSAAFRHLLARQPVRSATGDEAPAHADEEPAFHLDYDEHLAPYVDGTADDIDREIVESHVELCAQCAEQLRELFSVKEELARATPSGVAASPPIDDARAARSSPPPPAWRERFSGPRGHGAFAWPPARVQVLAGIFVCALLLIVAALLWRTHREQTASVPPPVANTANRSEANVSRNNNTPPAVQPSPSRNDDTAQANADAPTPQIANQSRSTKTEPVPRSDVAPQVAVSLDDGGRTLTLDRQGRLSGVAADVPAAYRELLRQALRDERIETASELAALIERPGRLRGAAEREEKFALLNPIGTLVRAAQPVLRWQPLAGADSYTVKIYDARLNTIAASPPLAATQWTPPAPLAPGRIYSWQVTAMKDGARQALAPLPQEPQALFRVLSPEQVEELQRAERIAGDSHLLRAIVYAKFGLMEEAEGELRELQQANTRSAVARRLAESLRRR